MISCGVTTEGAEVLARLANPETKVLSGAYYDGRLPAKASAAAVDPDAVAKLWRVSESLTLPGERRS